ncbi:MAG: CTP synthase, partial [Ruminococcus sp.]|nr:CTP synthase [Ruminococcus sp.]
SKPTQHSVKELQGLGVSPDIIILRTDEPIKDRAIFEKIAHFCNVWPDCVIENITLPVLYEAPLMLEKAHISDIVCRELNLKSRKPDLADWEHMVERIKCREKTVTIGLVGKYVELHDAYLSVAEALRHAGYYLNSSVEIKWIDSENITEENVNSILSGLDGIIVPGGFGQRGIEGMILSAKYARENRVPYFGICLGMQIAVIEFARNVAEIENANSGEFAQNVPKVIDYMPGQNDEIDKGGTLRLGAYPCVIKEKTSMHRAYGKTKISERHRHRYEFNNDYRDALQSAGLTLSGLSPDGRLVETVELSDRDFYIGVQYHPEFKSRPNKPHPLFSAFIKAALR